MSNIVMYVENLDSNLPKPTPHIYLSMADDEQTALDELLANEHYTLCATDWDGLMDATVIDLTGGVYKVSFLYCDEFTTLLTGD